MAEMLSPGVFIQEIDASAIVPTVSNSIGVFCGDFVKGPIDTFLLITNVDELILYYGKPTNINYNDWYQAYNFLQYGDKLLIARAGNQVGTKTEIYGCTFNSFNPDNLTILNVSDASKLSIDMLITFDEDDDVFQIVGINGNEIILDRNLTNVNLNINTPIFAWEQIMNGVVEVSDNFNVNYSTVNSEQIAIPNEFADISLLRSLKPIFNYSDYENKEMGIAFSNPDAKIKFISRNPGTWANDLEICIANPDQFEANSLTPDSFIGRYAFEGVALDPLFEYAPTGDEVGIVIRYKGEIVETFKVSFNPDARDYNNKSTFIETVINTYSSYVYVKVNDLNNNGVANYTYVYDKTNFTYVGKTLTLKYASDSRITEGSLLDAYNLFDNKEELDVDIIIGNEFDNGSSAKELVDIRKDCISFIGSNYGDIVGKKSAIVVSNLINWRRTGPINYNNMFVVACGNYKYQYDRYNDKYRWINIAGDIAGLRSQTNTSRASWWASAGLERGQIKNVIKLGFNPTQSQRDMLYKNGINPICSFPGQGTVMWGQKTLLDKPSSFDRVNVRGLFNTLERALGKMAKYQIMEFNDNFTRNRIVSMIKPYLGSVQAGRGIQDFLVICDETNNTADVISRNQLVVDIFIKPTYVAEFIQLKFTNAGTNSFAEVIGA